MFVRQYGGGLGIGAVCHEAPPDVIAHGARHDSMVAHPPLSWMINHAPHIKKPAMFGVAKLG
jgi:hypothetical protein